MQTTNDLITALRATGQQIVTALPAILTTALLLLLGWLLARSARKASIRVLRWMKLDLLAEQLGIEGFLVQGGVEFTTITLLGGAIYWGVLFLTLVVLLNMLVLPAGIDLLERIVRFVPNVMVAVIVLIFGSVVSRFVGSLTYAYLSNVGSGGARTISAIARYAVLVFVVAMAAEEMEFHSAILASGFQLAFGALCLALALAFGLGGREWAARVLDRLWKP